MCGPDQTRPAWVSDKSADFVCCLVVDLSAQSRHVLTLTVGLVWSGRRHSPWVGVVEFDTDQTLSETWSQARTCLVGSMWWNLEPTLPDPTSEKVWSDPCQIPLHGPDPTKSADLSETLTDPTDF